MIYNLVQYLKINLPSYVFIANGFSSDSPQNAILVSETGGEPAHWYNRTNWAIQFLSRAQSMNIAKEQIDSVYTLVKNKFGLSLPAITINLIVYPIVKTYQISPIQSPGYIGADEKNLEMFSFNSIIVTK